jgi:hypothetical protein
MCHSLKLQFFLCFLFYIDLFKNSKNSLLIELLPFLYNVKVILLIINYIKIHINFSSALEYLRILYSLANKQNHLHMVRAKQNETIKICHISTRTGSFFVGLQNILAPFFW